MAYMAERRGDTAWSGLGRITSDAKPGDQERRPMPEIHATRLGEAGGGQSATSIRFTRPSPVLPHVRVPRQATRRRGESCATRVPESIRLSTICTLANLFCIRSRRE